MTAPTQSSTPPAPIDLSDRLIARDRPAGLPIMHQSWDKLLFLHWEVPAGLLRPLIPAPLAIDMFDGKAWLSITPLYIYGVRPAFMPAVPYFSWMRELNVRTYVHIDGVPGVWFFSLDADNTLAVLGARSMFKLPYYLARMDMQEHNNTVSFESHRPDDAKFTAEWSVGRDLPRAEPGSLDFFLVERYCLYSADSKALYRCRIHHEVWPLQECAGFSNFTSTMAQANGIPEPIAEPILHCGGPVHVDVWPLEKVRVLNDISDGPKAEEDTVR
jgi:hypothetical protein